MKRVSVVTDSTANIPTALAERLGITVVPLTVTFGRDSLRDGVELSTAEFYQRLRSAPELPTTSQPAPGDFSSVYNDLLAKNCDIVSIHLSRKLSGTVDSAEAAKDILGNNEICVIDSNTTSFALGFAALRAAEAANAGAPLAEVERVARQVLLRVRISFIVDTLEYLQKGGRIGGAQALLGSLLSIKPVLTVKDGQVEVVDRVRTMGKALEQLSEHVSEAAMEGNLHLAVLHSDAEAKAQELRAQLDTELRLVETHVVDVGPTIATHIGPGALGVAYYLD